MKIMGYFKEKLLRHSVSEGQIEKICAYYQVVSKWADKVNITANKEPQNYLAHNVLDALISYNLLNQQIEGLNSRPIIELGCGGGFIGLHWQIFRENVDNELYLVDSDRRRISFCADVIRTLKLNRNIQAIHSRSEEFLDTFQHVKKPIIVSRAVWPLDIGHKLIVEHYPAPKDVVFFKSKDQGDAQSSLYIDLPYEINLDEIKTQRKLMVYTD